MGLSGSQQDLERVASGLIEELDLGNSRPLDTDLLALFVDGKYVELRDGDRLRPACIYLVVGLGRDGKKRVLACIAKPGRENLEDWKGVLRSLIERGLRRVMARRRVAGLEGQMREVLERWSLRPMVEALIALRGVDVVTAMTVLAELGDLTRFDSPRELMSFLGLVPSEHSSGPRRRQGAITKTGNGHVRRVLVESAWSYRFPARKTRHLRCKASAAPPAVQAIAWAAQKRLCARYRHLYSAGKAKCVVTTAVARELVGFIWAIACEVMGRAHATRARS